MEKRSLIFVFLMSFAFILTNHYLFDRASPTENKSENAQEEYISTSHLPIYSLYENTSETSFSTYACRYGELFTALTKRGLPNTLYLGEEKLYKIGESKDGLIFFSGNKNASIETVVPEGISKLQMVGNFSEEHHLKHYSLSFDQEEMEKTLKEDAIALIKVEDGWFPYGYWISSANQFHETSKNSSLISIRQNHAQDTTLESEEFYTLENGLVQMVFSNHGGALAEVNLALKSKNSESVINPIALDTRIAKEFPENNYFPLEQSYVIDSSGKKVLQKPEFGGFTPLLRRNIKNEQGKTIFDMPSKFYAGNLLSDTLDLHAPRYSVTRFTKDLIEFSRKESNRKITKTFRLLKDAPYTLSLDIQVDGDPSGLWLGSGIPEVEFTSGSYSPSLQYYAKSGKKLKVESLSLPKTEEVIKDVLPVWASNANGYFGIIMNPRNTDLSGIKADQVVGSSTLSRLSIVDSSYDLSSKDYPGYELFLPFKNSQEVSSYLFFMGPYQDTVLKEVDNALATTVSGGSANFIMAATVHGWMTVITEPFSKFLLLLLNVFHSFTNSWGLSIILLTLVLRLILYPINSWSYKSNAKLQELNPKIKAIQEKYKKDPKRMQMETAMLYKTAGVNPFSSGCLPLLIQIPFLFGMFDLLKTTFELRGAGFIPGWIDNLAAPDVLFSWSTPIIFFGTQFHLLPFILGGLTFLQQKVNLAIQKRKGVELTDQQKQMGSMGTILSLVFIFIFYSMPSGLNIYWIFSTLFGIIQQWFIMNRFNQMQEKGKNKD